MQSLTLNKCTKDKSQYFFFTGKVNDVNAGLVEAVCTYP